MERVYDAMAERKLTVNGKPTSLLDLGYDTVGLDDNWQDCGAGPNNTFHSATGTPLVNTKTFPSLKGMVSYGKSKGLKSGFYSNNCICHEHLPIMGAEATRNLKGDAQLAIDAGFEALKADGCGPEKDLQLWTQLLNASGVAFELEK